MLTDDELRALADALEPHGWKQVAAHLRAQADAQPVAHYAMLDSHRRLVERAIQDAERPSGMSTHDGKARIDASVLRRMLAIIDAHPAPAVPAGWKWVPVEPTPEMIDAGCDVDARAEVVSKFAAKPGVHDPEAWVSAGELLSVQYRAMLAAAPAVPQAEPADRCRSSETPDPKATGRSSPERPASNREDAAATVAAGSGEQAEPKPTPASGDDLSVYKEMADSYRNDEPTGAPYGIIDPDYGRVYTIARKLAWEEGYAIGLHGSFTRDLDLIAVPWTDTACEPEHLIRRIVDATGLKLRDGVAVKPHGRRAWTLLFPAFGDPRFVDLSVMPRIGGSDAE